MIEFQAEPEIGTLLKLDEQVYELRSLEPYQRKDATWTKLLVWESRCPGCGAAFQLKTTLKPSTPNRRCEKCKAIGKPVKGKRGRRVQVEIIGP